MKKLHKATTIKNALLAFLITFCTPALVMMSYETYEGFGSKLGKIIYEATHESAL